MKKSGKNDRVKVSKGTLIFHSNFESGNLEKVHMITQNDYEVFVRPDGNNPSYRLWFYFSVRNNKKQQKVLISICNFSKTKSLYRQGMTPVVRSTSRPEWERIPGKHVFYYKTSKHRSYILSFLFVFDRDDDIYYFAYCYPYTYTDLQKFLRFVENRNLKFFSRTLLCPTILKRRVDLLTITSPTPALSRSRKNGQQRKKMVFISARIHPGETPSSFIMHGIISFLISEHPSARYLRDICVFKLVPMLCPDGVFLGNYRCSSIGNDLNRYWLNPSKWAHPTIYATRELLFRLNENPKNDLDFFLDLHSHSVANGAFMYCNDKEEILRYPKLLALRTPAFSFADTRICKDTSKLGSGRRALGELLQVAKHCYTLEVSFYRYLNHNSKTVPFTEESYMNLGKNICLSFLDFYSVQNIKSSKKM